MMKLIQNKIWLTVTNKYHISTRDAPRDQIDYGNFMLCDSKGSITKKFNYKFKEVLKFFDLRSKNLIEASINSMPAKLQLLILRKNVKINKKSSISSNNHNRQTKKSKRIKKMLI